MKREITIDAKLKDFLIKENVYDIFMNNNPWNNCGSIADAFIWINTLEGNEFWNKLNVKFYRFKEEKLEETEYNTHKYNF